MQTSDKIKAYIALTYIQELGVANKDLEKELQRILIDDEEHSIGK